MTEPLVVISAFLGATYDVTVKDRVRPVDEEPAGSPILLAFVERLRAFGFKRFFLHVRIARPSWMSETERGTVAERARALLERSGLPGAIDDEKDNPDDDGYPARRARLLADRIEAAPDDVILDVQIRACFLPRETLWRLVGEIPDDSQTNLMYFEVFPWSGAFSYRFSNLKHRSEGGKSELVTMKGQPPASPLPSSIAFSPTAAYGSVMEAVAAEPPASWSYELLGRLWRERPALFYASFPHVGVELTNDDNLPQRLRSPRRLAPDRAVGRMEPETWQALLAGLPADSRLSMDLWDFGEPLLHPQAIAWIGEAAARGIRVDLYTNGLLLDPSTAARLVESGVDAVFYRLDAATEATYGRVGGDAALFSTARDNLRLLAEAKRARARSGAEGLKPTLVAAMTEMEETQEDADAFFAEYDLRTGLVKELAAKKGRAPTRPEVGEELRERGQMIDHALYRHDDLFRGAVARPETATYAPLGRFPCRQLGDGPYVLWTGDILPCRQDLTGATRLGHVREGIEKVWRGAATARFIAYQAEGRWDAEHFCQACREWYYSFH